MLIFFTDHPLSREPSLSFFFFFFYHDIFVVVVVVVVVFVLSTHSNLGGKRIHF
jgi:hypothetical protein